MEGVQRFLREKKWSDSHLNERDVQLALDGNVWDDERILNPLRKWVNGLHRHMFLSKGSTRMWVQIRVEDGFIMIYSWNIRRRVRSNCYNSFPKIPWVSSIKANFDWVNIPLSLLMIFTYGETKRIWSGLEWFLVAIDALEEEIGWVENRIRWWWWASNISSGSCPQEISMILW